MRNTFFVLLLGLLLFNLGAQPIPIYGSYTVGLPSTVLEGKDGSRYRLDFDNRTAKNSGLLADELGCFLVPKPGKYLVRFHTGTLVKDLDGRNLVLDLQIGKEYYVYLSWTGEGGYIHELDVDSVAKNTRFWYLMPELPESILTVLKAGRPVASSESVMGDSYDVTFYPAAVDAGEYTFEFNGLPLGDEFNEPLPAQHFDPGNWVLLSDFSWKKLEPILLRE